MFTEIIEYENILDDIVENTTLSEHQTDKLIKIITENPTLTPEELYTLAIDIYNDEKIIMDGHQEYVFDPILNENTQTNLLEIALPIIRKYIPDTIISHLTEKHARVIVDSILDVEIMESDNKETLSQRIDEMFSAGMMAIPVQGLRPTPTTVEVVTHGVFAPMLHKGIQFDKKFHKKKRCNKMMNKSTVRDALKGYKMLDSSTPLEMMLPKILVTLKHLLGKK